jgi:predicted HNH restriction endonuclease
MEELWTTPQSTWCYYFIHDSSENVNDELVERIVAFYVAIGRALTKKKKPAKKKPTKDITIEYDNEYAAVENRQKVKWHIQRERNRYLSLLRKQQDKYQCQICEMTFKEVYGKIGKDFAEAHHIVPLAQLDGPQTVSVDDLITVCANCHRMLHKLNGGSEDIEELKGMLLMRYKVK